MSLPSKPEVQPWQEVQHMSLSQQLAAKMQSIHQDAALLMQACASACSAQEDLQSQARSIEVLVAASSGMAHHDAQAVEDAMQSVQKAMERHQDAVEAVASGLASLKLHDARAITESPGLTIPMATAFNRVWNQRRSPLLHLPEAALAAIVRAAGKHARLICCQAAQAYGAPGTTLVWDADRLPVRQHADQMAHLAALVTGWRWREQVQELRLPSAVHLDLPTLRALAAALPNLQRLGTCVAACHAGAPTALNSGPGGMEAVPGLAQGGGGGAGSGAGALPAGGPSGAPAPAPQLPTLAALTALECCVPSDSTHAAFPFALPRLRRLSLQVDAAPRNGSLGAALWPLTGLTHLSLRLHPRCGMLPTAHQQELHAALCDMASSLQSLRLGAANALDVLPPAVLLQLSQLSSLTVDASFWDDRCMLPPLQQLPRLQHLQLTGPEIWVRAVAPLADVLAGGSPSLRTLHLPLLQLRDASFGPSVHRMLRDMWCQLPEVTCLSVGCLGGRPYHWQPGSLVPTGRTPWLTGVEQAARLQRLSIAVDVLQLAQVACLQTLQALTHLEVCLLGDLLLQPLDDTSAAEELARLEQLRALRLGMKGGAVGVRPGMLALALQCVRQVACLPELREVDLVGLGPLRDEHAEALGALLVPECGVRRLVVHDATGSSMPGVRAQAQLCRLLAGGTGGSAPGVVAGGAGGAEGGESAGTSRTSGVGDGSGSGGVVQDVPGYDGSEGGGLASDWCGEGFILVQLLHLQNKMKVEWSSDKGRWFG